MLLVNFIFEFCFFVSFLANEWHSKYKGRNWASLLPQLTKSEQKGIITSIFFSFFSFLVWWWSVLRCMTTIYYDKARTKRKGKIFNTHIKVNSLNSENFSDHLNVIFFWWPKLSNFAWDHRNVKFLLNGHWVAPSDSADREQSWEQGLKHGCSAGTLLQPRAGSGKIKHKTGQEKTAMIIFSTDVVFVNMT